MQPEIHVLGITLQTFGLCLGAAFIVCGALSAQYLKEIGKPVDWAYEFVFAAIIGGIAGARLWWVAEHWSEAQHDFIGSLFGGSGLVFHGGALGGAIAVLAWSKHRGWLDGCSSPRRRGAGDRATRGRPRPSRATRAAAW